jgi:hypothetical protein
LRGPDERCNNLLNVLAALREMKRANDILWDDAIHTKNYTETLVLFLVLSTLVV